MLSFDTVYIKRRKASKLIWETLFVSIINFIRQAKSKKQKFLLKNNKISSVLVIRYNQLGDAVASSAFIQAIRDVFPGADIDVLASQYNKDVYSWIPGIKNVHVLPLDGLSRWRFFWNLRNKYDVLFQTLFDENYFHRTYSGRVMAGSRGILVGRARGTPLEKLLDFSALLPIGSYVGKLMSLLCHFSDKNAEQLVNQYPSHSVNLPKSFNESAQKKIAEHGLCQKGYVVLNISAREEFRSLSVDQAGYIAQGLIAKGHKVLLSYSPDEKKKAERVQALASGSVICSFESIGEAMAAVRMARLYVGPDTGTAHFAASTQVPCVVLFAHTARPEVWSPYGTSFSSIHANQGQAVYELPAEIVVEQALELLSGKSMTRILKPTPTNFPLPQVTQ